MGDVPAHRGERNEMGFNAIPKKPFPGSMTRFPRLQQELDQAGSTQDTPQQCLSQTPGCRHGKVNRSDCCHAQHVRGAWDSAWSSEQLSCPAQPKQGSASTGTPQMCPRSTQMSGQTHQWLNVPVPGCLPWLKLPPHTKGVLGQHRQCPSIGGSALTLLPDVSHLFCPWSCLGSHSCLACHEVLGMVHPAPAAPRARKHGRLAPQQK